MANVFDLGPLKSRLKPETSFKNEKKRRPEAAVAVVIDPRLEGGSLLLIKRKERQGDPWSGQIAFPGGHKSLGDTSFLETAIRESMEEVGVQLRDHEFLGGLSPMYSRARSVLVAPFVFSLKSSVNVRLNEEVEESFWVPLRELSGMDARKSEVRDQEGKLTVDSYVYEGHVIWGLTFRILNILLNRL